VITGLGIVSPIGIGVEAFWRSALAGRSGIGRPTLFDASKLPPECQIVGEVQGFDPRDWMPGPAAKMAGRFSQFAVAAAKMALDDSGLDIDATGAEKIDVSIGSSMIGLVDVCQPNVDAFARGEQMDAWVVLETAGHAAASRVAIQAATRGQTATMSSACIAGLDAIAWARDQVTKHGSTAVLAGGTDAPLAPFTLEGFRTLGALSRWDGPPSEASRPFDRLRSGLVLAEGAAVVVVEEEAAAKARGATIYAAILGSASLTEASHMRTIDSKGTATARTIRGALSAAAVDPHEIDYICAHGNSLIDYDAAETAGIKAALGKHAWSCAISSIKSMCGQSLAAAGAMQVVASCLAIRDQIVAPTANYRVPDPECDLDYVPNAPRRTRVRSALVHAQSIGGSHTAVVLRSPDDS
jgi:3-oxoacyl-[acyl-carrier-protein] synthase II